MRAVLLLPLTLLLASCATMSPDECRFANWHDVGLGDGLAGRPLSVYNSRIEDCTEAAVRVDGNAYLRGRDEGLQSYCRLENAVVVGLVATDAAADHYGGAEGMKRIDAMLPLGRMATGADIAGVVSFLASPDAAYVSGARIAAHGGGERPLFLTLASGG